MPTPSGRAAVRRDGYVARADRLRLRETLDAATATREPPQASGAPGDDRLPVPWLPEGLHLDRLEGAGEVQTPVLGAAADDLRVGDRAWFRHAKAGELGERFADLHLVRGRAVEGTVPTCRGEGRTCA